nr:NAD-dependent protein deacetylase of SIR2 family [Salmonella sp. NCTC 7297]
MQSRRFHRLSRFRKNKRLLRERLRQRIFFRDRVVPEMMENPRVLVLTGAGISAESGIRTFRAADGLWEEHRVEDVATPEGFAVIRCWCRLFIMPAVSSFNSRKFNPMRRIWR